MSMMGISQITWQQHVLPSTLAVIKYWGISVKKLAETNRLASSWSQLLQLIRRTQVLFPLCGHDLGAASHGWRPLESRLPYPFTFERLLHYKFALVWNSSGWEYKQGKETLHRMFEVNIYLCRIWVILKVLSNMHFLCRKRHFWNLFCNHHTEFIVLLFSKCWM